MFALCWLGYRECSADMGACARDCVEGVLEATPVVWEE